MNRDDERVIEGLKRQSALRLGEFADADRLGWKSGFGTKSAMEAIGVEQPLVGFITKESQVESGGTVSVGNWANPLFEAEVAVRIDSEIGPGASAEEAAAAVGAVAAAIELVDLTPADGIEEILAGNIFHRQTILGEFIEARPEDLENVRIVVTANQEKPEPTDPRDLIGAIGQVVASLADQLDLIGETMKPGDVVITGAAAPPAPAGAGDSFAVEISGGSRVTVGLV